MNKKLLSFPGVTLIEVVFAIIIFGTGIFVIMNMITSNIGWLYDIRNKDTALAIAKEGIDIIYHIRDSNLERGQRRNCAFIDLSEGDACGGNFYDSGVSTQHVLNFDHEALYDLQPLSDPTDARIYFHTGSIATGTGSMQLFWYNHNPTGGDETMFSRIIEFAPVSGHEAYTGSVLELSVRVEYGSPSKLEEVVLQSIIGNIR